MTRVLDRWIGWGVGVLAALLYVATVTFDFAYDDVHIIQTRTLLHSLGNWREFFTVPWWSDALYRPITLATFALDWAVGGGEPWIFHLINALAHGAVTVLLWQLARRAGLATGLVAALFFAVHPVHVEAVANIVGRAEVLATLAAVAAALAYSRDGRLARDGARPRDRWFARLATMGALVLGLGSKETAFAIPGILLITDWLDARLAGETLAARTRRHAGLWLGTALTTATWIAMRAAVLGDVAGDHPAPGLEGLGLPARMVAMSPVVVQWVRLLAFPLRLSPDYSPNHFTAAPEFTAPGIAGFALLGAAVWWGWRERRRDPWITFGLLWLGGTLFVIANVLVPSGVLLAERSLYLPSVGAVLVLGRLAQRVVDAVGVREGRMVWGAVAVLAALGTARTVNRLPVWRNTNTVLTQVLSDAPTSFRAWWVAGTMRWDQGHGEEGEHYIRRAIAIYPLWLGLWLDYGLLLERDQRFRESGDAYWIAFRIDSAQAGAAARALVNYVRAEQLDSARSVATTARRIAQGDYRVQIALGDLAVAEGRPLEAMTWRRQVAWRYPTVWQYWYLAADAALLAGRCSDARALFERVNAMAPDQAETRQLRERFEAGGC